MRSMTKKKNNKEQELEETKLKYEEAEVNYMGQAIKMMEQ